MACKSFNVAKLKIVALVDRLLSISRPSSFLIVAKGHDKKRDIKLDQETGQEKLPKVNPGLSLMTQVPSWGVDHYR